MSPELQTEVVRMLEASRDEFYAAVEGVTETEALAHPEEGSWSILECAEHVATVEERFLIRMLRAQRLENERIDPRREAEISRMAHNRTIRLQAPDLVQPKGRFANIQEALDCFQSARSRNIEVTTARYSELHWLEMEHPFFGKVNGTEMIRIIAGHASRHADQIRELRAAIRER